MVSTATAAAAPLKLGVFCDLLEERWFSMDLLAEMLLTEGGRLPGVELERVRPALPALLARAASPRGERTLERWGYRLGLGFGRYVQYPLRALRERSRHDFFHIADHSYGHLALELPRERVGIYCHDLDAFRPVLDGSRASRLKLGAVAHTLLAGLRRARVVFHSSRTVGEELRAQRIVPPERLVHAPYGVAAEFQPEPGALDAELAGRPPFVMHVGSLIPRKNPEFLVPLIVEILRARPELEMFQMGGTWTESQRGELERGGVLGRVHQFSYLARPELSAYLRATRAVVLPSLAEGFGLPVVEALACGAPVVANDIPVLVEVGGEGVVVRRADSVAAYAAAVLHVVDGGGPAREARLQAAARYTWAVHARTIVETYRGLAGRSAE
ncbi:MAG TPA: glycosyltransferase [Polyangiaceae bacterium]|nr:glycosyltransferase [Polyangiaceae bacterium]